MTPIQIINQRRIIDGPDDNIRAISFQKQKWANSLWEKMLSNNWVPEQVTFTRDKEQFKNLTSGQQTAYLRALAFLSNLDSIQTDNLSNNIVHVITDPDVRACIYRQTYEEALHTRAYSTMIETVFQDDPLQVYNMVNTIEELKTKSAFISQQGKNLFLEPTIENKILSVVNNIILEGVYFFTGFLTFFSIHRITGTMQGSTDNIQYIQRDELTHLDLFINIFLSIKEERPEVFTPELFKKINNLFVQAAELEINWGKFIIEKGFPGLSDSIIDSYVKYLANTRATAIGCVPPFSDVVANPVPWVEENYQDINKGKKNFFETRPLTYSETAPVFSSKKNRVLLAA